VGAGFVGLPPTSNEPTTPSAAKKRRPRLVVGVAGRSFGGAAPSFDHCAAASFMTRLQPRPMKRASDSHSTGVRRSNPSARGCAPHTVGGRRGMG